MTTDTVMEQPPKGRGRPATGHAMSAAERKRASRGRQIDQANELMDGALDLSPDQLAALSLDVLFAMARRLITCGWTKRMTLVSAELMRRTRANEQA